MAADWRLDAPAEARQDPPAGVSPGAVAIEEVLDSIEIAPSRLTDSRSWFVSGDVAARKAYLSSVVDAIMVKRIEPSYLAGAQTRTLRT